MRPNFRWPVQAQYKYSEVNIMISQFKLIQVIVRTTELYKFVQFLHS
jgi:hypothetical protein